MQDCPAYSEMRAQGRQAGAPEPSLTKASLGSCVQSDTQQSRQRRGGGADGVRMWPVWGGKGCGGAGGSAQSHRLVGRLALRRFLEVESVLLLQRSGQRRR